MAPARQMSVMCNGARRGHQRCRSLTGLRHVLLAAREVSLHQFLWCMVGAATSVIAQVFGRRNIEAVRTPGPPASEKRQGRDHDRPPWRPVSGDTSRREGRGAGLAATLRLRQLSEQVPPRRLQLGALDDLAEVPNDENHLSLRLAL